jgi:hypothetical protein
VQEVAEMPVVGVTKFERFFREEGLDVDKNDLKQYSDFIGRKLRELLDVGQAAAKQNQRDIIEPRDLPITHGLERSIQEFRKLDEQLELSPILDDLAGRPPLESALADATESRLPAIVGGLSVALAKTIKIVDPAAKIPHREQWERAFRIFDTVL